MEDGGEIEEDVDIAQRMKSYEAEAEHFLQPNLPFVVRLDGHCFAPFCKKFKAQGKPWDVRIHNAMLATAEDLLATFRPASVYTCSDEITLVFPVVEPREGPRDPAGSDSQLVGAGNAAFKRQKVAIFAPEDEGQDVGSMSGVDTDAPVLPSSIAASGVDVAKSDCATGCTPSPTAPISLKVALGSGNDTNMSVDVGTLPHPRATKCQAADRADRLAALARNATVAGLHNGKIQKIVSLVAARASVAFRTHLLAQQFDLSDPTDRQRQECVSGTLATFDARIFSVPSNDEILYNIIWRQSDVKRNSKTNLAVSVLGHNRIQHTKANEAIAILSREKGVHWRDQPEWYRWGTLLKRNVFLKRALNPKTQQAVMCVRSNTQSKQVDFRGRFSNELVDCLVRKQWQTDTEVAEMEAQVPRKGKKKKKGKN